MDFWRQNTYWLRAGGMNFGKTKLSHAKPLCAAHSLMLCNISLVLINTFEGLTCQEVKLVDGSLKRRAIELNPSPFMPCNVGLYFYYYWYLCIDCETDDVQRKVDKKFLGEDLLFE